MGKSRPFFVLINMTKSVECTNLQAFSAIPKRRRPAWVHKGSPIQLNSFRLTPGDPRSSAVDAPQQKDPHFAQPATVCEFRQKRED
jgi:hypothetical protein